MQQETTGKEKFTQKLSSAIHKSRYVLISVLGVFAIIIITWIIITEVRSNRLETSTIILEAASEKLDNWLDEEDEEKASSLGEELVADLENVIDKYSRMYAGDRALFLLASYYFYAEQWELSAETFLKTVDANEKSYLAPVSRINAAVALEEAGKYEDAIEIYAQVIEKDGDVSPEIPRVLFSLGRLNETHGTEGSALEYYNRLVDEYPSSSWTNLAQDRIIYLNLD